MKKFLSIFIISIFLLGSLSIGNVHAITLDETAEVEDSAPFDVIVDVIELDNEQRSHMMKLGFTNEELDTMTLEEFNKYNKLDGELTSVVNNYYKIESDLEGNVISTTVVPEDIALEQSDKPEILSRASDTTSTSWMKMTTTSSKLSNGNTLLKNSYTWLKSPTVALTDVVGISHSSSAVKVPGTEGFAYKYTDGTGTHSLASISTTKNGQGIAKKFNLKKIGTNSPPKS